MSGGGLELGRITSEPPFGAAAADQTLRASALPLRGALPRWGAHGTSCAEVDLGVGGGLILVVHPTNREWVSSPQLQVDIAPTYPIYNQGCNPLTKWDEPPSIIW